MELEHATCYRALRTRDRRFDGRFFTGVTSTGVYCRPVCPAKTPLERNCTFFACAAAAEDAGFRPCRRCRPETSPGTPAWRGTEATVSRALRLIEAGALDRGSVEELAFRLGVGDRHLRRLFGEQLGASPLAVARVRRVHFAKRMIEDTDLPITQIAFAAGFNNVRRFNAAVRQSFDRTPSEIRRAKRGSAMRSSAGTVSLRLAYREPFDWPRLLAWIRPRLIPGVEQISGETYRRTIDVDGVVGTVSLSPDRKPGSLKLVAPVEASSILSQVADRMRHLCDLGADPEAISSQLAADPVLRGAVERFPGVRVPGCWDPFEMAVRAILGQQVSVAGATTLAGRLVKRFGHNLSGEAPVDDEPANLFPRPEVLAEADLAGLGLPTKRAETIQIIARALANGEPLLEMAADLETSIDRLTALPGVGDWTAQYIAMRALGEPDAFPAGDLGLRKALAGADGELPSERELRRRSEAWRPWRAYAAVLLWNQLSAKEKGE